MKSNKIVWNEMKGNDVEWKGSKLNEMEWNEQIVMKWNRLNWEGMK